MSRQSIAVTTRVIQGKKVSALRLNGVTPVTVYGKGIESLSLSIPTKELIKAYKIVGHTGLLDLQVDGNIVPVVIKSVQFHPVSGDLIHAQLHKVNLKEKMKAMVPVEVVGEALAVRDGLGTLLQMVYELEVEALPTEMPEKIEVNVEKLSAVDDQFTLADISLPKGVELDAPLDTALVKVAALAVESETQNTTSEEATADGGVADENAKKEETTDNKTTS